jgi:hypothetical protein
MDKCEIAALLMRLAREYLRPRTDADAVQRRVAAGKRLAEAGVVYPRLAVSRRLDRLLKARKRGGA